ncbi:MAG: Gfo/Idh/MocA family oxidoreductase [Deltaproteobacteria bacterium]|jgi:predicted dehydrogenase|nr:Gfo/Idh/MocA family oxidoreductase [Deltaproteobacteria bacterium]
MKIGLIGCGLIGLKRAEASRTLGLEVVAAADLFLEKASSLCSRFGGLAYTDYREVLSSEAQIVNVAVTHDRLAFLALEALKAGKHVLLEKPGGRCALELAPVVKEASEKRLLVKAGYNHRFHPALNKAREIVDKGAIGPLLYIRGRYGHGGRLGYEKEWRMDKDIVGGGELIDQGSHLIDLARWFLGDFSSISGSLPTYYWPAQVEDNAFMLLTAKNGANAFLHASWTEWKNLFSFEITGRDGKLSIEGLGGSYGLEQLTYYKMLEGLGPPETVIWQYPFPDNSWTLELKELVEAIEERREPIGSAAEALEVLKIIDSLYLCHNRES